MYPLHLSGFLIFSVHYFSIFFRSLDFNMDLSIADVGIAGASKMVMLWAVGSMTLWAIPNAPTIFDKIELVKKILSFIGDAPELVNHERNLEQNIQSLKRMMTDLLLVKEDVRAEVENSEFQQNKKRRREVEAWFKSVKKKEEEVTKVETEIGQTRAISKFLFRAWLGSCVEAKKNELSLLLDQKRSFEQELVVNANGVGRERLLTSALIGRVAVETKDEIWRHLIGEGVTKLGVEVGQGLGKSTIMTHVYNRVLDDPSLFDCAFYVSIKEENDIYQLQTAIARELKLQGLEGEDDVIRRAAKIHRALVLAKRFVLILDGLMSSFEMHEVGIPIEKDGGKLVVVACTRSIRVCRRMLCQPIVEVKAVTFEDGRELFMEPLKPSSDLSVEIKEIADKIIQMCDGVPRTIIRAAQSLRNEDDVSMWKLKLLPLCTS